MSTPENSKPGAGTPDSVDLDSFAEDLQRRVNEKTRETYGQALYERWRNPPNIGELASANAKGEVTGDCGDTMRLFLRIEHEKVQEAGFLTDGCGSSIICGSTAAEMALGKSCEDITAITGQVILDALSAQTVSGGLPEEDQHCAWLAANALHEAVGHHYKQTLQRHPEEGS